MTTNGHVAGASPTRHGLGVQLRDVLRETETLIDVPLGEDGPGDPEDGLALLELAREILVERIDEHVDGAGDELSRYARQLLRIDQVLRELHARARSEREDVMAVVHDALSRLRAIESPAELLPAAVDELGAFRRFDTVAGVRVEDGEVTLAHAVPSRQVPAFAAGEAERETIRRRTALLHRPVDADKGLAEIFDGAPFVAAPVIADGRVAAVLASCRREHRPSLGQLDRDTLWTFAVGLGYALDRAVLMARLEAQREAVRHVARMAESVAAGIDDAKLRVASSEALAPPVMRGSRQAGRLAGGELSCREREVLEGMRRGARNAEIGADLFISEETVKSHVKSILRKLGATNRAEAVALYLNLGND